jgi:quercetin dioxygenase-like cupin family protein
MLVGHYTDKPDEPQEKPGNRGATMRRLITGDENAENFFMRVVVIEPGGCIGLHSHPYEHEIFVLNGVGRAMVEDGGTDVMPGDYVFIPGHEVHGFENTGAEPLEFICCISNPDRLS